MHTFPRAQRLTIDLPLAPTVAIVGGLMIALSFLVMPGAALARLVGSTGLPALVAAAEPPLGLTARTALALLVGGGFAGLSWFGLELLAGSRNLTIARAVALFRRSDVHPDGPPRPPLFAARELGTPFLDVKAPVVSESPERDQPLVREISAPLLPAPVPPPAPEAAAPLLRPSLIDPGDRIEIFELTPVARTQSPLQLVTPFATPFVETSAEPAPLPAAAALLPVVGPETAATVTDLLARLERGLAPAAPAGPTLEDTLGDLRRMAAGGR